MVLCSPDIGFCVNNKGFEAQDIADARNTMPSTSYGVMDSGYKYMYDRYNDVYRWVPLNGDIAGLCAQTDRPMRHGGHRQVSIEVTLKMLCNWHGTHGKAESDTLYTA